MTEEDTLAHYGTPRHSGRYPWGSGADPYQGGLAFLAYYDNLHKKGISDVEIAKGLKMTTSELRSRRSISSNDVRKEDQRTAIKLKDTGMSTSAIAREMKRNESSVRGLLNPTLQARANRINVTADILKANVEEHKYLDVGAGTANRMGISDNQLKTAIASLKDQGYKIQYTNVPQAGITGNKTSLIVLTKADVTGKELFANKDKIRTITDHVNPDTGSVDVLKPPVNVSSKRVDVVYGPDGGSAADGVIYLRPGVPDISLGHSQYAQVRIAVDGTHYIKGMAMYKHDMPAGTDILFNTNKENTGNKLDALKPQEKDELNPFGSITRQKTYHDANGKEHQSVLNIVNEEGDWYNWSKNFSSQFLSKQANKLAKDQLALTFNSKQADLHDILQLTNPEVKKKLLQTFSDEADSSAVKLKATGLPRTASHVILPINSLKDNEIYAPKYNNGETVVLVRHPHGGKFEIPELTVNNSNKEALRSIKGAKDAVGINANVAARLSGADFDGDAVLVIPNNNGKVKTAPALAALKNFDPKTEYKLPEGKKGMNDAKNPDALLQHQMGVASNLITDMTIKGANTHEIARAVRHSMVVIDAKKHNLDYKQSAIDNNINELKRKYQGSAKSGAATLVSRTTSELNVPEYKARPAREGGPIDKATGEKKYVLTGNTYVNKAGEVVENKTKTTKGAYATDAYDLSSGTPIESIYADHANRLKALANTARKEMVSVKNIPYSQSAKAAYANEVNSLNAKLNIAQKNAPLERQAQLLAQSIVKAKVESTPGMDKADLKKINGLALTEARSRVGATKKKIEITDNEWAAIQSGALSASRLKQIVDNTDVQDLRTRATPRNKPTMNPANVSLAKSMMDSGYTAAEVAARLGVSTSTIYSAINK